MKKITTFISLSFLIINLLSAQGFKNQIGFNSLNILNSPVQSYDFPSQYDFSLKFAPGIIYKRELGKIFLRASLKYYQGKYEYSSGEKIIDLNYQDNGKYQVINFAVGIEKEIKIISKLNLIIAFDLVIESIKKEGIFYNNGDLTGSYSIRPYNYRTSFINLAPTLGLSYDFTNRISASIESNIFMLFITINDYEDNMTSFHNPISSLFSPFISTYNFQPFVNPISLFSVNYKFNTNKKKNGVRYK